MPVQAQVDIAAVCALILRAESPLTAAQLLERLADYNVSWPGISSHSGRVRALKRELGTPAARGLGIVEERGRFETDDVLGGRPATVRWRFQLPTSRAA